MRKKQSFWGMMTVFLICVVACSPNLEIVKKQAAASRNLGEAYYGQGDYTSALKEFLKAETLYAEDPYLQNDLGIAYMAKEKPDIAIEHFKKAVELNSDYAPARNNLGLAYIAKNDWDAAIASFKKVSEDILYATPHYPLSNLGLAYYNKREYKLAEKYYRQSLKLQPEFVTALLGLGRTYIAMGKIPEAVTTLEKAVKSAPKFGANYFFLAEAYALSHSYKKAIHTYQRVIELAPDTSLADEAKKEVRKIGGLRTR